jgi:hypothetical protein
MGPVGQVLVRKLGELNQQLPERTGGDQSASEDLGFYSRLCSAHVGVESEI